MDFYCASCRLIVELDGGVHRAQEEYDTARTAYLREHGYRVIRSRNEEVLENIEGG